MLVTVIDGPVVLPLAEARLRVSQHPVACVVQVDGQVGPYERCDVLGPCDPHGVPKPQ